MSWKTEVIADSSGKWVGNMCRFATEREAQDYVRDLAVRWTSVRDTRTFKSTDPVNYRFTEGRAVPFIVATGGDDAA